MAVVWCAPKKSGPAEISYSVDGIVGDEIKKGIQLIDTHAYSILRIDQGKGVVHFINPHDTKEVLYMEYDAFKEYFDYLTIVHMDNEELLKNVEQP